MTMIFNRADQQKSGVIEGGPTYTQEQLDAAVLAERRRCADICEDLRKGMVDAFIGRDTEDYFDGYVDGCNECQWAILETPAK